MDAQCGRCGLDHSLGSPDCPARRVGSIVAGRYRLDQLLGVGGFGAVFHAVHLELERSFALKLLLAPHSRQPGVAERFVREARVAASLEHPGIVAVTDFGANPDGDPFLVMELLRGETVQERLHRSGDRLGIPEVLAIARQSLEALGAAHAQSVVHRDIKPENLFLVGSGTPARLKILDFGLAKALDRPNDLTKSGEFIGTVNFASAEQLLDFRSVDARSDVYSLGATLYYLLTGTPPARGGSTTEVIARIVRGDVERHPRERAPATPDWLDRLIARALARSPEERFGDASEMLCELDRTETVAGAKGDVEPTARLDAADATAMAPSELAVEEGGSEPRRGTYGTLESWLGGRWKTSGWAVALVVALGSALWLWHGAWSPQAAGERADGGASAPPDGMVSLETADLSIGSSLDEIEQAFSWCQELAGTECRRELYERERPRHAVRVGAFYLDRAEVSNGELAAWLAAVPAAEVVEERVLSGGRVLVDLHRGWSGVEQLDGAFRARDGWGDLPAVQVTWFGAAAYCRARGRRLPTETEWERAARGVEGRAFPWGAERPDCAWAVFGRGKGGPCSHLDAMPVGVLAATGDASPEGVLHLGGNVSEWVADAFAAPYPECSPPCVDPFVEGQGPRVVRGGNWEGLAEMTRAAGRGRRAAEEPSTQIGFRCARGAEERAE